MNSGKKELVFVTDFDGTISDDDFFQYTKEAFFDEGVLVPWTNYLEGKMFHFDALKEMYGTLRVSEEELINLVKKVKIDNWVIPTFNLLYEHDILIYIVSAGCDYYINLLIGSVIEKYGIKLITNSSSYSKTNGLVMEKPVESDPFYDEKTGISKLKVVEKIKENCKFVVFAGDGPPDIEPALAADVVFAKKILLDLCIEKGINSEQFYSYKDIYNYFERELKK